MSTRDLAWLLAVLALGGCADARIAQTSNPGAMATSPASVYPTMNFHSRRASWSRATMSKPVAAVSHNREAK